MAKHPKSGLTVGKWTFSVLGWITGRFCIADMFITNGGSSVVRQKMYMVTSSVFSLSGSTVDLASIKY